ncbi:hypothetical protein ACKI1Q_43960, partial [Streptomyces galilaeus]|uniref:hypothetical protein n=1 Tax=Streptomyces galilaeus TaxID=33899 RepID=UPI0038F6727E
DLAAALNQRPGYVSDLRHGRRWGSVVPPDKLTAFARAVGLSPAALGKLLYECYPENNSEKIHESC